jgi:glycosyltransferase involved in cell wall biosynthesis
MSASADFRGRLGLQQRVLPTYRVAFFEYLAQVCTDQLSVYAGSPRPDEGIHPADGLLVAQYQHGRNLHLFRSPFYLCWQLDLISWLKQWNPDALIMEANPRYLASRNAIAWMRKQGRPILGWGLGAPEDTGSLAKIRSMYRRRFISQFNVLIAYSERGAGEYAAHGFPEERIVVAANSVELPPKTKPERPPLAGRPARMIFVGRLQARKRVDLLLKACAQLDPIPEVVIVGDGPERAVLESLAKEIFPTANFLGALFDQQLQHALEQADLFVMPGTGGLAVQQAMSSGLPVIVAEGDGTQNDLVSGDNGWLISPGNLDALIAALRSALQVPELLEKMGAASFDLAVKRFNIHAMRDQFLKALAIAQEVV